MFAQCVVITIIIAIISIGFFPAKRKKWALLALPLGFLPFVNVIFGFIYRYIIKTDYNDMAVIVVLTTGTVISCVALGMLSMFLIKRKKTRSLFICVGVVFNVILEIILLKYYLI